MELLPAANIGGRTETGSATSSKPNLLVWDDRFMVGMPGQSFRRRRALASARRADRTSQADPPTVQGSLRRRNQTRRDPMLSRCSTIVLAGLAGLAPALPAAAQSSMGSRESRAAGRNGLAPDLRAEVLRRVSEGNTPRGMLEVMLLNAMQARFPASRIVAVDTGGGVAVIQTPESQLKALTFNKRQGLQLVGEVVLQ
ncbi:hypothetical protein [Dankookia sp. P2]|uniref:hypothetical protein n=1 Tax=Dankookia sp. P2 TaxID=3423955 RepID=UPI003D67ED85